MENFNFIENSSFGANLEPRVSEKGSLKGQFQVQRCLNIQVFGFINIINNLGIALTNRRFNDR